jgi:membrane-bound metal-dependent hydrolase YbcI (DUF457 family)
MQLKNKNMQKLSPNNVKLFIFVLAVLTALLAIAAEYFLFAFFTWSLDPGKWSGFTRVLFGILGAVILHVIVDAYHSSVRKYR